jgi:hypothetical protein
MLEVVAIGMNASSVHFPIATGEVRLCWYVEIAPLSAFLIHLELHQLLLEIGKWILKDK